LRLRPAGVCTSISARNAAMATAMSEGCTAMQAWLAPRMACMRLKPARAEQPLPGWRLLQGMATS
jgi:hypothetical protein